MFEENNSTTQPLKSMPIFNNWDVVTESWYCVGEVHSLAKDKILSVRIGKQELVVFKGEANKVHCLDAFCSHLGLKLSTGSVVDHKLRCAFHHWSFDGAGEASHPSCSKMGDSRNLNSYPVEIRYGLIWVWAGTRPRYPLPFHPELSEGQYEYKLGKSYQRPSHPHISLLNALDLQHVNTVHALELEVSGTSYQEEASDLIHYDFQGRFKTRLKTFLTGGGYKFSVRYVGATIGFLKALEGIKLFGTIPFPPIYATFGYRQENKTTVIQPIFLTPKRSGVAGKLVSLWQLHMTKIIYNRLKNEDGVIYENIRFVPNLTSEDKNIGSFIAFVNRLTKSNF